MPWHIAENHSSCPTSKPWAVIKNADGSLAGCHPTKKAAGKQMAALYANEGNMNDNEPVGLHQRAVALNLTEARGDGLTLEGYAAVFNSPTLINDWLGEYEEVIAPGAFNQTIRNGNPVLMFNHGKHAVIGEMPIGSIQSLREDPHGLLVSARLFDNWMTEPLRQAISADPPAVDGMSFRFSVPDGKETWDRTRQPELRTIHEVKLYELGPVVFPAYKDTTVALRSLAAHVPGLTLVYEKDRTEETDADPETDTRDEAADDSTSDRAVSPDEPDIHSSDSLERRRSLLERSTAGFHAHLARLKETPE